MVLNIFVVFPCASPRRGSTEGFGGSSPPPPPQIAQAPPPPPIFDDIGAC